MRQHLTLVQANLKWQFSCLSLIIIGIIGEGRYTQLNHLISDYSISHLKNVEVLCYSMLTELTGRVICKVHYDAFPALSCRFWFCRSAKGPRNSFLVALGFLLEGGSKIYSLKVNVARGLGFREDEDHFEENR